MSAAAADQPIPVLDMTDEQRADFELARLSRYPHESERERLERCRDTMARAAVQTLVETAQDPAHWNFLGRLPDAIRLARVSAVLERRAREALRAAQQLKAVAP